VALALFFAGEALGERTEGIVLRYAINILIFTGYAVYIVRRERIDLVAMMRAVLRR